MPLTGFGDTFKVALMLEFLDKGVARGLRDVENRVNSLRRSADRVSDPFTNLQSALSNLGNVSKKIALVGGAITGALAYPTYQAMQFEDAIAKVATMLDSDFETTKKKFYQHIIDLSNFLGQSADNIASAMYQALSAGIPEDKVLDFLEEAGKAAVAGATDLFTAVDGLTSALNAYGLSADEVTRVSDLFFTAVKEGKTTFEELAQGIGRVAPIASESGVSLEELLAATSELTKTGLSTSEAFTSVRSIIEAIVNPTEEAKRVFELLGVEIDANTLKEKGLKGTLEELMDAIDAYAISEGERYELLGKVIGRVEGLNGVLVLAGKGHEDFSRILEEMNKSQGATAEAYEKMASSAAHSFRRIMESLKNLALEIGDLLLPVLEDLINRVRKVIEPIRDWMRAHEELSGKLLRFVGTLGLVLMGVGTLGWVLSIVGKGLLAVWALTGPWGLALIGVAAAIGLIVAYREQISDFFDRVKKGIEESVPVISDYVRNVDELHNKYEQLLKEKGVPEPLSGALANFFANQEAKIKTIRDVYEKVRDFVRTHSFADVFEEIRMQLEKFGQFIAQTPLGKQIQEALDRAFIPVVEKIRNLFEQAKAQIEAFITGLVAPFVRIKEFLGSIFEDFLTAVDGLFGTIETTIRSTLERISGLMRSVVERIRETFDFTSIVTAVETQFETMTSSTDDILRAGLQRAVETVQAAWAKIQEAFNLDAALVILREQLKSIISIINDTLNNAQRGVQVAWEAIIKAFRIEELRELTKSITNVFQNLADSIQNAFSGIVDTLRGLLSPIEELKEKVLNAWRTIENVLPHNWFKKEERQSETPPPEPTQPQVQKQRGGVLEWFKSLDDKFLQWLNWRTTEPAPAIAGAGEVNVNMNMNVSAEINNERDIREFARQMAEITTDEVERAMRRNYGVVR